MIYAEPPPPVVTISAPAQAAPGRITGVGGVFVKSRDPKALASWYKEVLGIEVEMWGGALLRYDVPNHPQHVVWRPLAEKSKYFAPSTKEFMLNFAVDDLDAVVARLKSKGIAIVHRDDSDPNGRFAWIMDPEGTKIELLESKPE